MQICKICTYVNNVQKQEMQEMIVVLQTDYLIFLKFLKHNVISNAHIIIFIILL